MNRTFVLIFILTALFLLIACRKNEEIPAPSLFAAESEEGIHYLEATVLEVNGDSLLVQPVEGSWELLSSDQIRVSFHGIEDEESLSFRDTVSAGDRVRIGYDGMLAETYPAQITRAYSIRAAEE